MNGTISQITVRVSRKVGDENYGSFGVEAEATESLAEGANVQEEFDALDAFLTAAVGMSVTEKKGKIAKTQAAEKHEPAEGAVIRMAPDVKPAPEVERVPVDDDGNEFKDIKVDFIKVVFSEKGEKRARAFGKPFDKFGVVTYPEALEAVGFDLDAAEPGNYALPAPYTTARILLGGKNEKGFDIPKKVDHFVK